MEDQRSILKKVFGYDSFRPGQEEIVKRLLGGQGVTFAEYEDLFSLLLRSSALGHIPQTLDAVVLASAGKMRLDAPDYVFVLGLAEGEFPCAPS